VRTRPEAGSIKEETDMGATAVQRGRTAEEATADYRAGRGWRILARNQRTPVGELDLVCEDGLVLVMVEVKARSSDAFGRPLESIGPRKERRLRAAAGWWLAEHGGCRHGVRFDVVVVELQRDGGLHSLAHLADVFGR